jgi:hypothetical protein
MVRDLEVIFGKVPGGQSVPNDVATGHAAMWKKKSIFWELEYWKDLEVRSSIDVMHMMKNVCVRLLGFLGMYGKTKDTPEAREDQQRMKDLDNMHPQNKMDKGRHLSPASYALTKAEKEIFFWSPFKYQGAMWLLVKYKGNNKYDREKIPKPEVS